MKTALPILCLFFFCACSKNNGVQLPPITHLGLNTFGCKVNGTIWGPENQILPTIYPLYGRTILPMTFSLAVNGTTADGYTSDFYFNSAESWTGEGFHIYGPGNYFDSLSVTYGDGLKGWSNTGNSPADYFQITYLDTVKRIISGIFSFTLYNGPTDSVSITDGRFDFSF